MVEVQVGRHIRTIHHPRKIRSLHAVVDDGAGDSERRRSDFRARAIQKIAGDFFQARMFLRGIAPIGDADQFASFHVEQTEIGLGPSQIARQNHLGLRI